MVDQQILLSRAKHITDTKKTSCPCAHSLSAHTTNNICSFWFYSTLIKRHENQKLASAAQHLVAWRNIYTHTQYHAVKRFKSFTTQHTHQPKIVVKFQPTYFTLFGHTLDCICALPTSDDSAVWRACVC